MGVYFESKTLDSAVAAILDATLPLFTILIAHLVLRDDRITIPKAIIDQTSISDKAKFQGLSKRERETAALVAHGISNRAIAQVMTVGEKTVETYVTRILNKLGFDSRVQIATWAVEKGLISALKQ